MHGLPMQCTHAVYTCVCQYRIARMHTEVPIQSIHIYTHATHTHTHTHTHTQTTHTNTHTNTQYTHNTAQYTHTTTQYTHTPLRNTHGTQRHHAPLPDQIQHLNERGFGDRLLRPTTTAPLITRGSREDNTRDKTIPKIRQYPR